jgi:hypothetical protein
VVFFGFIYCIRLVKTKASLSAANLAGNVNE